MFRPETGKVAPNAFVTIGAGENRHEIGPKPLGFFQYFAAGRARQRDIQEHRVNTTLASANQLQCRRTIARLNHRKASALKQLRDGAQQRRLIFNYQDADPALIVCRFALL